jgi:hypothetical protein
LEGLNVSYFSNHFPEVVQEVHDRVMEEEYGWPEEPTHALDGVRYIPTPDDWAEYADYLDSLPAGPEPEPEDIGEPCGQCFPDDAEMPW